MKIPLGPNKQLSQMIMHETKTDLQLQICFLLACMCMQKALEKTMDEQQWVTVGY